MTLQVALTHRTSYRYDRPVSLGAQTIRLRPAPHTRTPILAYALRIEPDGHFLNWQQDPQGNFLARVVFPDQVTRFEVTVDLLADMATINPFDFFLEPEAERWPFAYDPVLDAELLPFRTMLPAGPLLRDLLRDVPREIRPTVPMLMALNAQLRDRVEYVVRLEPGVWSADETLAQGRGSCRDSAWLLVQVARHLGLAARFVSGYLIQLRPDRDTQGDGPQGAAADFTDLHAWAEIYLPGAGWIGFDVTSGLLAGEGHIPLAASPEPASAAAISGWVGACETQFDVAMGVTRLVETPRSTAPYGDAAWQAILDRGEAVDRLLKAADVRLTMGGEPTFVASGDPDAEEWNGAALGPTKRPLAGRLIRRLAALWSPGAVLQHGVGKHCPGEPLPRWVLRAHWREDGTPVWNDPALLASDDDQDDATAEEALHFAGVLASRLGLDPAQVLPAYEDIHYYLWREHRLPANLLAEDARLADPLERVRLARLYAGGPGAPAGSVLPLRRVQHRGERIWQSGRWLLRSDPLFLVPGDGSIGSRLPLPSLSRADPASPDPLLGPELEPEPFAQPRLPPAAAELAGEDAQDPGGTVRTALTVQSRDGLLHVFLPPLHAVQDWVDLVAAVEATAGGVGRRIILEGCPPPHDPRLQSFSVTPEPGVIEVKLPPSANWGQQVQRTRQLYEAARQTGLGAEKFMLDGRHVGTGGGSHLVMGAASPEASPFLRRPDLLKSLLGFWHNHPSLSYLFSGLLIGPNSRHPRVDEARQAGVGELEIALARIRPGIEAPPALVDRLLRNLLTDVTGDTRRGEFGIDTLYAPHGSDGRLGLVELRALEMPPHPQMAAAQALLLRAAIAAFWQHPYQRRLVRWGTRLHDDFMLPHYVHEDLLDALEDLAGSGVRLDPECFAPHEAFRFPLIGSVTLRGIELSLHQALEPWPMLGEIPGPAGGTVRHIDDTTERVQLRVRGWHAERYLLACNGVGVPLSATTRAGEQVAGVRFKARDSAFCLHPTLRAQAPLTFDVFDRWSGRSVGGMTHHLIHPGGRNYEARPVNANEAEARRRVRFQPFGHTPGAMPEPCPERGLELPRTLDLRRAVSMGACAASRSDT